jgi:hypothetical protein
MGPAARSLALAAVFIVLVIQFRAFAPALIIMSAAPLSLLGVFVMLLATATALNVSSFMGIILSGGTRTAPSASLRSDQAPRPWSKNWVTDYWGESPSVR